MDIGFIGTGIMGAPMAAHLMRAGHTLQIHTRTPAKAQSLLGASATWHDTPEALTSCPVIFTMLSMPADVEDVYKNHLLPHVHSGTILADFTTSSPALAVGLAQIAETRSTYLLDTPVTGGDVGAKNGTLSILAGGNEQAFQTILPLLQCFGSTITHFGSAGSGQHAKLANQIVIAGTLQGVAEALAYGHIKGLDCQQLLKAIGGGAASSWQLNNLGPKMLAGDFKPGFMIQHLLKDIRLALDEAGKSGLALPALALARARYEALRDKLQGTQALIQEFIPPAV